MVPELALAEAAEYLALSLDGVRKRIRVGREAVEAGRPVPKTAIHPDQCRKDENGHWWVTVEEADRRMVDPSADPRQVEIVRLRAELDGLRRLSDTLDRVVNDRAKIIESLLLQNQQLHTMLAAFAELLGARKATRPNVVSLHDPQDLGG